jgi:hypothetical protein
VGWDVRLLEEVECWLLALDDDSYDQVAAAIDKLEHDGPTLGRPLVDRIEGSRHHNMKELRPDRPAGARSASCSSSTPSAARCSWLPATRRGNWQRWYDKSIPEADRRYDAWLSEE